MADSPLVTVDEFNRFALDALPFLVPFGIAAHAVDVGRGTVKWTYDDQFIRPPDFVSGPIMMALADAALYLALFTEVGIEPLALTSELKTNFLRPARGTDLHATATMVKVGRRTAFGVVEVTEAGDPHRVIAHATGTYVRPGDD